MNEGMNATREHGYYTMSGGWITPPPWIYSIRQLLTKLMKFSRQPVHKFYIQDPLTVCPPYRAFLTYRHKHILRILEKEFYITFINLHLLSPFVNPRLTLY